MLLYNIRNRLFSNDLYIFKFSGKHKFFDFFLKMKFFELLLWFQNHKLSALVATLSNQFNFASGQNVQLLSYYVIAPLLQDIKQASDPNGALPHQKL